MGWVVHGILKLETSMFLLQIHLDHHHNWSTRFIHTFLTVIPCFTYLYWLIFSICLVTIEVKISIFFFTLKPLGAREKKVHWKIDRLFFALVTVTPWGHVALYIVTPVFRGCTSLHHFFVNCARTKWELRLQSVEKQQPRKNSWSGVHTIGEEVVKREISQQRKRGDRRVKW